MKNILNNKGLIDDYPNCFISDLFDVNGYGWANELFYASYDDKTLKKYKNFRKGNKYEPILFVFINESINDDDLTYGLYGAEVYFMGLDIIISEIYHMGDIPQSVIIGESKNKGWNILTKTYKKYTDGFQSGINSERFYISKIINEISDLKEMLLNFEEDYWYQNEYLMAW